MILYGYCLMAMKADYMVQLTLYKSKSREKQEISIYGDNRIMGSWTFFLHVVWKMVSGSQLP